MFDRHEVAVGAQLLTSARQMPDLVNDVTTKRSYVLIFPIEASQVTHLVNRKASMAGAPMAPSTLAETGMLSILLQR